MSWSWSFKKKRLRQDFIPQKIEQNHLPNPTIAMASPMKPHVFPGKNLIKFESKKCWKKCEKSPFLKSFSEFSWSATFKEADLGKKITTPPNSAPVEINPVFSFWTSPVPYFGCKLGLFDQPSSKTFQPQLLKSQISFNQFLLASKKNPSETKTLNPLQTSISNPFLTSKPTQKIWKNNSKVVINP